MLLRECVRAAAQFTWYVCKYLWFLVTLYWNRYLSETLIHAWYIQVQSKLMCGFTLGKVITFCNLIPRPHLLTR